MLFTAGERVYRYGVLLWRAGVSRYAYDKLEWATGCYRSCRPPRPHFNIDCEPINADRVKTLSKPPDYRSAVFQYINAARRPGIFHERVDFLRFVLFTGRGEMHFYLNVTFSGIVSIYVLVFFFIITKC